MILDDSAIAYYSMAHHGKPGRAMGPNRISSLGLQSLAGEAGPILFLVLPLFNQFNC